MIINGIEYRIVVGATFARIFKAKTFAKKVRLLERPYIKITETEYSKLKELGEDYDSDFVSDCNNTWYTFGRADDGYALMKISK